MRRFITKLILVFISFSSFSQPPGYYFNNIKGTTWVSSKNINDTTILDETEIGLRIYNLPVSDTLKGNVWIFADSILTVKCYDNIINKHKIILSCEYINNELDKIIIFKLNDGRLIQFEYNSISTGTYIGLYKQKKRNN